MLRQSRRSATKRRKRGTFRVRGQLDRTQEVAGSSPASSMKDLQMPILRVLDGVRRAPGGKRLGRRQFGDRARCLQQMTGTLGPPVARRQAVEPTECCGSARRLVASQDRPPPYHGGSQAVLAYTVGHSRSRFSCKSDLRRVSAVPARARACSSSCTRLVPAACCLFEKRAVERTITNRRGRLESHCSPRRRHSSHAHSPVTCASVVQPCWLEGTA
jgi:hypothetical protein